MEIVLSQRFEYAHIKPLKDYCRLEDKSAFDKFNTFSDDTYDTFGDDGKFRKITQMVNHTSKTEIIDLPEKIKKGKRRVYYYYSGELVGERITLQYPNPKNKTYFTQKDRHIKSHYGNPFSSIELQLYDRSIVRNGDKVTVKLFNQYRVRKYNKLYFRKMVTSRSITFNLKTGNFTTMLYSKDGKRGGKSFKTNTFKSFYENLSIIMTSRHISDENGYVYSKKEEEEFLDKLAATLSFDNKLTPYNIDEIYDESIKMFVNKKKIKVPNDYAKLLVTHYPTEKYLKKNDRKLVASILDAIGIKSKVTIKMLHDNLDMNLSLLFKICKLLGDDYTKYINNIDSKLFIKEKDSPHDYVGIHYSQQSPKFDGVMDKDKEAICFVLNDLAKNGSDYEKNEHRFFNIIVDHIDMIKKIKPYYPDACINARTWKDFNLEHSEFTKIISLIRKGWVTEYIFNMKMVEDIEKPITVELYNGDEENPEFTTETFYPFILKREEDYAEEGNFMHHCVATYSDKDKSIIVSVRTKDAKDRVTCEFTTQTGNLVQARHFCNKRPPADIELAIDQLKVKTAKYARIGLLNCVEKKKTQVKINGIEVAKPTLTPTLNEHLFNYEVPF